MKTLKYLFVGTGRCGTCYFAKLLTSLGVPCGHESVFDFDGINAAVLRLENKLRIKTSAISGSKFENGKWVENEFKCNVNFENIEAESSYMAAPFLDSDILKDTKIIHLIRNPIEVVNSFVNKLYFFGTKTPNQHAFFYEKFIYKTLPFLKNINCQYDKACSYYILWNELIESKINKQKSILHKIEDGCDPVLDWLKIEKKENMFSNIKENSFPSNDKKFSIEKIENSEIKSKFKDICEKYNYL